MSSDTMVKVEKQIFNEKSKGLDRSDVEWLLQLVVARNPELHGYEKDPDKEWKVYSRATSLIYGIDKDKPSDVRTYVEKQLKRKEYIETLNALAGEVFLIKPGDAKACDALSQKIEKFVARAEKEFPGFSASCVLALSETAGDILAVKTRGEFGNRRMLPAIELRLAQEKRKPLGKRKH